LVVIDGVVSTYDFLQTIDYNLIESVTVHKGANGAALYGSQAANGVVIVKTKKSLSNSSNNVTQQIAANSNANKYNKRLKVNVKNTKPAYLSDLNNLNSSQEVFNKYESDKELFKSNPSYYLDMFNYFEEEGNTEYSKTVLNDIINSEDAKGEQLRAFAYRLDELNRNEEANVINNKLLNTYPNDVKSYRDLALGMADVGKSQIAFNTLSTFLDTDLGEIKGSSFNRITLHEVNNMIQNNPNLKKSDLASHNIIKTEFDLRIVIDWNRDDVNLNVKVVDPFSEIASADNAITRIGGEFSGILGLNEYVIRHAKAGDYYVVINNSEDLNDEITYVKITTFEDYGRNNEKKKITTIKLEPKKKDQVIMKVKI